MQELAQAGLLDFLPTMGDWLAFLALCRFFGWRDALETKVRAPKRAVQELLRPLMQNGVRVPHLGDQPLRPTVGLDPSMVRGFSYWEAVWNIPWWCRASPCSSLLAPMELLLENLKDYGLQWPHCDHPELERLVSFRRYVTKVAMWEAVSVRRLSAERARSYPELPNVDYARVNYALWFLRFESFAVVLCFWDVCPDWTSSDSASYSYSDDSYFSSGASDVDSDDDHSSSDEASQDA